MKQRLIAASATLVFLLTIALTVGSAQISAQQPTITPSVPVPATTPDALRQITDIESRIKTLEDTQKQTINFNQVLLTAGGAFIALVTIFQASLTLFQFRREGERGQLQAVIDKGRYVIEQAGAEQVSKMMNLVHDTLGSRLESERKASEAGLQGAEQVSKILEVIEQTLESRLLAQTEQNQQIVKLSDRLDRLSPVVEGMQTMVSEARQAIEDRASELVKNARHDFKQKTKELARFAEEVERFNRRDAKYEPKGHPDFTPRVLYIYGIAAHYASQPEKVKSYLTRVIGFNEPQEGEPRDHYNRRIANAYYYIGLTESNFANYIEAIRCFEQAIDCDSKGVDLLTRIVLAEAYVMNADFDKATPMLVEIVQNARKRVEEETRKTGNPGLYRVLESRATLIKANIKIMEHADKYLEEAIQLLDPVHKAHKGYYYVTTTLAQLYLRLGDLSNAQASFAEAYEEMRSNDLFRVSEVRSRILLLMLAGMSSYHGLSNMERAQQHLDEAFNLRDNLPKIDSQVCTVFSPLSKRNESSEIIAQHIQLIREGQVSCPNGNARIGSRN